MSVAPARIGRSSYPSQTERRSVGSLDTMPHQMRAVILIVLICASCCYAEEVAITVPSDVKSLARDATVSFQHGDYRRAEKLFELILSQHPDNVWALSNLGVTRFRAGKLKAAEETLRRAVRVAPKDFFSHHVLGIVLYSQGRLEEASEHFDAAGVTRPKAEDSAPVNVGDFLTPLEKSRLHIPPSATK